MNEIKSPFDLNDGLLLVGSMSIVLAVAVFSVAAAIGAAVGFFVAGLVIMSRARAWTRKVNRYVADLDCAECGGPLA